MQDPWLAMILDRGGDTALKKRSSGCRELVFGRDAERTIKPFAHRNGGEYEVLWSSCSDGWGVCCGRGSFSRFLKLPLPQHGVVFVQKEIAW